MSKQVPSMIKTKAELKVLNCAFSVQQENLGVWVKLPWKPTWLKHFLLSQELFVALEAAVNMLPTSAELFFFSPEDVRVRTGGTAPCLIWFQRLLLYWPQSHWLYDTVMNTCPIMGNVEKNWWGREKNDRWEVSCWGLGLINKNTVSSQSTV